MRTDALDYDLPDERIATRPAEPRDSARLMVVHRGDEGITIEHHRARDLPELGVLTPDDLLVVNQTRVLQAYLTGTRTTTGGKISGLFIGTDAGERWQVMLESRGTLEAGEQITLGERPNAVTFALAESLGGGQWLAVPKGDEPAPALLDRIGQTPLPPYIRKQRRRQGQAELTPEDLDRYNTVYATEQDASTGSVAAPTAGLHFTHELLKQLENQGIERAAVDLHVGVGTFAPVRTDTLEEHNMHAEWFTVPRQTLDAIRNCRARGGRLLVVGTTTVRSLESLPNDALEPDRYPAGVTATTNLFIHPDAGFTFRFTDRLMTNFHLPKSTLLALVASLPGMGLDALQHSYREAVEARYRFYSYGDAMLIV